MEEYRDGFYVRLNGGGVDERKWLIPVISHVITDWPEGQAMCLVRAGATASVRNCRVCKHLTKDFGDTSGGRTAPMRKQWETEEYIKVFMSFDCL